MLPAMCVCAVPSICVTAGTSSTEPLGPEAVWTCCMGAPRVTCVAAKVKHVGTIMTITTIGASLAVTCFLLFLRVSDRIGLHPVAIHLQ